MSDAEHASKRKQRVALVVLVLTVLGLIIGFAFFGLTAPLSSAQYQLLGVVVAIGTACFFALVPSILEIDGSVRAVRVRAAGTAAAFILVLVLWFSPWTPANRALASAESTVLEREQARYFQTISLTRESVALTPPPTTLHTSVPNDSYTSALIAISEGKLDVAEKELQRAEGAGTYNETSILIARGRLALYKGKFDDAVRYYDSALRDPNVDLAAFTEAGLAQYFSGNWVAAGSLLRAVSTIRDASLGVDHELSLRAKLNLAVVLDELGQWAESEVLMRQVLSARQRQRPDDIEESIGTAVNLVVLLWEQRKEEADPMSRQVLEDAQHRLGPAHRLTIKSISNRGSVLLSMGDVAKAMPLLQDAYSRAVNSLGWTSDVTQITANNYIVALWTQGGPESLKEAEAIGRKLFDARIALYGPKHPRTAEAYNNIGIVLARLGRHSEAQGMFEAATRLATALLPDPHPHRGMYEGGLGSCLFEQGKSLQAAPHLETSLDQFVRSVGAAHVYSLVTMEELVRLYLAVGEEQRADEMRGRYEAIVRNGQPGSSDGAAIPRGAK